LASLKRDVEDILSRLHEEQAPRDFRVVVILDELDKLKNNTMLDRIVESFKNLFTLNRCVFVFITDRDYFAYVLDEQQKAAEDKSYAPQHTFFTQKVFLPRSDFAEIKSYLDSIRVSELGSSAEQRQWDELVRHLAFVSRGHFFDLMAMLNELVQTSQDRVPRLRLTRERLSLLEFQQRARFQRMVELVYDQEHYPGHLQDHLNNRLLAALYALFDNLEFASFAELANGTNGQSSLDDQRLSTAQHQLIRLLQKSEAVSSVQVDGHVRLDWAPGLCREPVAAMMKLDDRQSELVAELEGHVERWRSVLDGV
jgi:hypothetical protein